MTLAPPAQPAPTHGVNALWAWLGAYRAHPDARQQAANTLALVLASDAPIYPLYLYFLLGRQSWPGLLAMWVVPAYAALPALARRHQIAAGALLIGISIANTALYAVMFGLGSRLQLFFYPTIALGLFLPSRARPLALALGAAAVAVFVALRLEPFAPLVRLTAAQYRGLSNLNEVTVATLTWFLMLLFSGMWPAPAREETP